MPALTGSPVKISGTSKNPVTITNNGSVDIYTATNNAASKSNHVGVIKPNGTLVVTDDIWLVTDGSNGSYSTSTSPSLSGGGELGYAEILANFNSGGVANTIYPITGLSIPVMVGQRPIKVEAYIPSVLPSVSTATVTMLIYEDGNFVGSAANVGSTTANKRVNMHALARRNPTPGSHTYEARIKTDIAATAVCECGAGFPAFIHAVEI